MTRPRAFHLALHLRTFAPSYASNWLLGIVAVAGTPVSELGFAGAIAQLRGPENTSILLSVRRKQGTEPVDMVVFRRLVRM